MDADPTELELADHAALELHGQLPFSLWNSYDPNLFRIGKFYFTVDIDKLSAAVWAITTPDRPAAYNLIEITSSQLQCVGGSNSKFSASACIPLSEDSAIGPNPICFEIDNVRLKRICKAFKETIVKFELDKNENTLAIISRKKVPKRKNATPGAEEAMRIQLSVKWHPMSAEPLPSAFHYDLPDTDLLKRALDYLMPLSTRKPNPSWDFPGVQFADHTAFSASSRGISKFHSAELPSGKFNLPMKEIRNIRSVVSRLSGRCMRFMTHDRSGFKSEFMSCSWETTSDWRIIPTRAFEVPLLDSVRIPGRSFQDNISMALTAFDEIAVEIKHSDSLNIVELSAFTPTDNFWATITGVGARPEIHESAQQELAPRSALTFKLADLEEIMPWDREEYVTIGLREHALVLTNEYGKNCSAVSILPGTARN